MKFKYIRNLGASAIFLGMMFACEDLTVLNENPNGSYPATVNPNLVISSVLTEASKTYVNLGYGIIGGVMQHTQKDGWFSDHNNYDWANQSWSDGYYSVLEDNQLVYDRAVDLGLEFHQGVSLVVKGFMFGLITDLWGDAPYTNALKGDKGGEYLKPSFDSQETIYDGILADLETANTLLSKAPNEYEGISPDADVIYGGDASAWRKLANSLALRYYMRISGKKADVAKAGIEKIAGNPSQYPIISSSDEDAAMSFPGASAGTAWPNTTKFDASESNFSRIKMCATLLEKLQDLSDPRIGVWAAKVKIPLKVDATQPAGTNKIMEIDGKQYRVLSPDVVGTTSINTDPEYVGLPAGMSGLPFTYNFNPTNNQGQYNPHVSQLADMYKAASGDMLLARWISAAEVHFILAEAGLKGWAVGDTKSHYEAAIQASLESWGVDDDYDDYIAGADVAYKGTLDQIMEQKWIASWTAATESWFDYRRTGLPALQAGPAGKRTQLPVRFYYMTNELLLNEANATSALEQIEVTNYSQADGENSAWSKSWVLQGTGKPW
ncbi:SusD/RagB family nutrient-binding outer membrane lipoprotein [Chryseolinea sp. T2]|uniref:SusD/RagB family nutrient-binding outer membrane lipoprotein n=1 Tax=Chryseolinea sp. T2 TaxID=3129255 RepID=UPI003077C49B